VLEKIILTISRQRQNSIILRLNNTRDDDNGEGHEKPKCANEKESNNKTEKPRGTK